MKKQTPAKSLWQTATLTHREVVQASSIKDIYIRLVELGVPCRYLPLTGRIVPKYGFILERQDNNHDHTITFRWREMS